MKILGLDLSLSSTGVAHVTTTPDGWQAETSRVVVKARHVPRGGEPHTLAERSVRLRRLAGLITDHARGADLVVVEGPSYASDTGKAHDRAGLWWLVVGRLTGAGLQVVEVPPSTVKTYATGKGNAGKDEVLAAVVRRYPTVEVRDNNEADALVLAALGARFLRLPIEPDLPKTHLRALTGVRWTPTT
ncbi:RuvC-like resolvase [Pseudanabaena phage Pam4]|nr:RuvC-like resolvase [Pseudanabaena phage Pam4]